MMKTRMDFVEKWAHFVIEHPVNEWSKMQAELIDSQIENAQNVALTRDQVDFVKGQGKKPIKQALKGLRRKENKSN